MATSYHPQAEHHAPTADYVRDAARGSCRERFPASTFSFLPADIVSQILNFGAPAPIDVQVRGPNRDANASYAAELLRADRAAFRASSMRACSSPRSTPQFDVDVDRTRRAACRPDRADVTNALVVDSGRQSSQIAPTFWLNPRTACPTASSLQTPQYRLDSLAALQTCRSPARAASQPQVLGGLADISRDTASAVVSHYDIQPTSTCLRHHPGPRPGRGRRRRPEGHRRAAPQRVAARRAVMLRGQVETMNTAFSGLFFGLLGAIVLIYLLIVVNFQSWTDPFVIITALPAALAGIVWMLFATDTTLSVPALTGAIMCMGVATANSHPGGQLRARAAGRAGDAVHGRDRGRLHPLPPGADDGAGHDHRHGADGAGPGRGRRAERAARPRRDRRPDLRDLSPP